MATRAFRLETTVPVDAAAAVDFLMQLDAHRGLHAYLEAADVVAAGAAADGPWWDWRVTERPALGPFRYRITFPARMTRTSATTMTGSVRAAPGCFLVTSTEAAPVSGGALVREETRVTAPRLLVGYMTRHARLAHERTFAGLSAELAGR